MVRFPALRKLGPETRRFLSAALRYRSNPVSTARRYWSLYRHRRFSPDEIHFFRLLDPSLTANELAQVVSKEELLAVQRRLNPQALHPLTEDKIRFHQHCIEAGLPVPQIYAIYETDGHSHPNIPLLRDAADLRRFLAEPPVNAFILKPVAGVHGDGITRLTRAGACWKDNGDRVITPPDIAERIEKSSYSRWMLQELVNGHPELSALSDTHGLQTIRVVTVVHPDGKVEILAARLRILCTNAAHDNFDYGTTGNVIANLDVREGTIRSAVGGGGTPPRICAVTRHPRTGRDLIAYRVPGWEAVAKLAHDAANAFMPLRTVGWDVAVTSSEPCLIEGNVTWDTLSGEPRMGEIYRRLQQLVA
jgi:hypothetical protein